MGEDPKREPLPRIPPPGRSLTFSAWCKGLYEELRRDLPDLVAEGTTRGVEMKIVGSQQRATITPERGVWYVRLFRGGRQRMSLAIDRHDAFTRDVAVVTVGAFFSDALATGKARSRRR